jgi:gluconate 5-dehydrogenase
MSRTPHQLFDLTGKSALVTGGSGGLGLQMAYALGEAGARLMLCSPKADELEVACADLQDAGMDARWVAADCAVEQDQQKLVVETLQRMGDIDILINNAGAAWYACVQDYGVDAWDKVAAMNVRAYSVLSHLVGEFSMLVRKEGRGGRIINVAPIAEFDGNPIKLNTVAGNTSKRAVMNFTRTLACEWGPYGINVNAIGYGYFPCTMTTGTLAASGVDRLTEATSLRRLGDDEDLKGITLLLASDAGKYITGQYLAVDGGVSAMIGA